MLICRNPHVWLVYIYKMHTDQTCFLAYFSNVFMSVYLQGSYWEQWDLVPGIAYNFKSWPSVKIPIATNWHVWTCERSFVSCSHHGKGFFLSKPDWDLMCAKSAHWVPNIGWDLLKHTTSPPLILGLNRFQPNIKTWCALFKDIKSHSRVELNFPCSVISACWTHQLIAIGMFKEVQHDRETMCPCKEHLDANLVSPSRLLAST